MPSKKSPFRFGEKLRSVREKKGLTLKIVANSAGVSESLVSQIERNRVSPAIDTLLSLAEVLDIDLEYLFDEYRRERPVRIIKNGHGRKLEENGIKYTEVLRPQEGDGKHALEAYFVNIPPGKSTTRGSFGHTGREMGVIISGSAVLMHEGNEYELDTGDSVSFSAASPHTLTNRGAGEMAALWICIPPGKFS